MSNLWVLPPRLEMAPARHEGEIQRTFADGLVGNVNTVLGLRVVSLGGISALQPSLPKLVNLRPPSLAGLP